MVNANRIFPEIIVKYYSLFGCTLYFQAKWFKSVAKSSTWPSKPRCRHLIFNSRVEKIRAVLVKFPAKNAPGIPFSDCTEGGYQKVEKSIYFVRKIRSPSLTRARCQRKTNKPVISTPADSKFLAVGVLLRKYKCLYAVDR